MARSKTSQATRNRVALHRAGSASYDDWQTAYEEAAGHLEYLSGISTDQTDGERDAQRKLAARLRAAAKRMTPNAALCQPAEPDVERKTNTKL